MFSNCTGAAPARERRGWFGRKRAAAPAAGAAAVPPTHNESYTAQPFNAPTAAQRDVELGRQPAGTGTPDNISCHPCASLTFNHRSMMHMAAHCWS